MIELVTVPSSARRAQTRPVAPIAFGLIDDAVDFAARVATRLRHDEAANGPATADDLLEHAEAGLSKKLAEILNRHAAAEIRLVRAVRRDRLCVRHPPKRRLDRAADDGEDLVHQRLDDAEDRVRSCKRHLDVHLREFGLAVRAKVFIAKALADLDVAVHARNHQDLLEDLRRLRQREELARVHAARHEVVARAFGCGFGQDGSLDFEKPVGVEVLPDRGGQPVAQDDVALQAWPAQIEVSVFEPDVFRNRRIIGNRERRRLCLVEHSELTHDDLDLARRDLGIHRVRGPAANLTADADDVLRAQALGLRHQRLVVFVENHLRHAATIAHVDEEQPAKVANSMYPSEQHDICPNVVGPERATGVCACQVA
jgi:hypothetical protein